MAVSAGPDIVENGLILCLDAANPRSYPKTGTGWFGLKETSVIGTLTNMSENYLSTNMGILNFDGIDDFVRINSTISLSNTFTISSFIRLFGTNSDTVVYGPDANGCDNWFGINSNRIFLYSTETTDVNNFSVVGTTILDTSRTRWYFITATINVNNVKLYLDTNQEATSTVAFNIGSWSSAVSIGRRCTVTQRYFSGDISCIFAYNRVLSIDEITQNFNALRGRFGL